MPRIFEYGISLFIKNPNFMKSELSRSSAYPNKGEIKKYKQTISTGTVTKSIVGSKAETTVTTAKSNSVGIKII
jgi:hypothetical protein